MTVARLILLQLCYCNNYLSSQRWGWTPLVHLFLFPKRQKIEGKKSDWHKKNWSKSVNPLSKEQFCWHFYSDFAGPFLLMFHSSQKSIRPSSLISTLLSMFYSDTCTLDKGRKEKDTRAGFKDGGKRTLKK